ncbi:MAG: Rne/Rng family ribonuclease, partial [Propionicimonas sp.]
RGGRRRRRSTGADDRSETDEGASVVAAEADEVAEEEAEGGEASDEVATEGASRRRRRRRRRGEEIGEAEDDPTEVVVRVREPRRTRSASDEVTGIEGSTRMEAKKQRRREGRAAGRRRTPILSESEFLARRESVDRVMLIRQAEDYSQIAVLEDGILVEHYVDRASATSMIGNIYLGRVQNVLPSMEAAFIDIGRGRNAVLYAGEVDWDGYGVTGQEKKVERVFKSGQSVLVQVSKDPVGAKGARLTSHISLPGRYIVYSPGGQLSGISRKLPENERKRLKGILDELIGPDASVIVRTAAEGATEDELVRDVNRLKAQWEVIEKKVKSGHAPQQLYAEPELTVRIVRDLFTEDFARLVVDGNGQADDAYDSLDAYVTHVAPHLAQRLERWDRTAQGDLFDNNRVHEQVAKALERKVFLPSGGSLIIDRTEAMTVVDVNTGRFTGNSGNLEATVTSNNLEAAEEIVRQLRLRDIGGIIVIDFIDMVLPNNRELLLRRLVECLGRDRTRHQVAEVTSLGLVQMTRKKIGTGLAEAFTVPCETCKGSGYHIHDAPVATQAPADGGDRDHGRRSPRPAAAAAPQAA